MARIVIVEDEKIIAEDIKWTLINFGYDVVDMISEPEDVLKRVGRAMPDLILMDIKLGDRFAGIKAATMIKDEFKLPVVFLTAYSDSDTIQKVLESSPYGYLLKPYNEKELRTTIEMALLRHRMEVALRNSEKKYRNLVENMQEGILLLEKGGKILFANQKGTEILNISQDDIEEKNFCDFIPENVKEQLIKNVGSHKKIETKIGDKYLELIASEYQEGEKDLGYLIVINDITDFKIEENKRKKTQQKLKNIESRLAAILDNLPHVVIYETNDKEMYLSSNIEKLLGYNREAFSVDPLFYMSKIHHDDMEIYKKKFKKWRNNNYKNTLTRWYRIQRADKEYIWVEEKMVKIDNSNEQSFMGIIIDITNIKRAEEEKKQMQKILLVSQKMEIVGKLAGGIAHDFNNLLMVINGLSEKLLNSIPKDDKNYKSLEKIYKAGEKASQLVNKLMGFSRRQISNPVILDINKHLNSFWDILSQVTTKEIELISDLEHATLPLKIKIDPVQLEQIIMNLIINAKDAIKEQGKIVVKTYDTKITKPIAAIDEFIKPAEYVVLEISDNGEGIAPENIERIFEPFFTTKKKNKGTGLGLSSVFGIIKQNSGYIRVESKLNHGTTFSLYFPRIISDESIKTKKSKKLKILFIDDEKDILDFIKEILSDKGHQVFAFDSPMEALDFYKKNDLTVDLVITDYTMPEMNGSKLIELLKQVRDDFKTIFITGYADTEFFHNIKGNSISVLAKPFTPKDLLDFIDKTF